MIAKAIPATASEIDVNSPAFSAALAERVSEMASRTSVSASAGSEGAVRPRRFKGSEPISVTYPNSSDVERVLPKIQDLRPY